MKTKRLLFGLIEMNVKFYNILYTLLCVCVLLSILVLSAYGLTEMEDAGVITKIGWKQIILVNAILIFVGTQIIHKKHYA